MTIGENNLNELRQGSWSRGSMQRCTPTYSKLKKYTPPPPPNFVMGVGWWWYKQRTFDSSGFSAEGTLTSEPFAHLYRSTHMVTWGGGGGGGGRRCGMHTQRSCGMYLWQVQIMQSFSWYSVYQTQNQSGSQIQFQIYYGPFFGPKEYPLFAVKEN